MLLNLERTGWRGWLFYQHHDGQWVSLRAASHDELLLILERLQERTVFVPNTVAVSSDVGSRL